MERTKGYRGRRLSRALNGGRQCDWDLKLAAWPVALDLARQSRPLSESGCGSIALGELPKVRPDPRKTKSLQG